MHVGRSSTRLISVSVSQLCLLVTTHYLISNAVNGNVINSYEFTVTHPNTHPAQRITTSTLHVDDVTMADDLHATVNPNVLDLSDSTSETSVINASASAKKVRIADSGLVYAANDGSDVTSLVGPDHVTLLTYMLPTSSSHAKKATSDSGMRSTESGHSSRHPLPSVADDVLTSSHSNHVTTSAPVTSTTANSSEGTWESWATHVERETLQQTTHSSNDSLDHQLMTGTNVTSPHHALVLIDRGQSVKLRYILNIIIIKEKYFTDTENLTHRQLTARSRNRNVIIKTYVTVNN